MDEILRRAFAAYFRRAAADGGQLMQPAEGSSSVETIGDLTYAVLRNNDQTLAVYRVRNDGQLKGLKRWPAALDEY